MDLIEIVYERGTYVVSLVRNYRTDEERTEREARFHSELDALIHANNITRDWESDCENWNNPGPHHDQIFVVLRNFPRIHPNQTTLA